jgi:hypothetical protein
MFMAVLAAALLTGSCQKELIPGTYQGQPITMGSGKAWSWMTFDENGNTKTMGFTLTDAAVQYLSTHTGDSSGNHPANVFEMQYPPGEVSGTPFQNCVINWNPVGHTAPVYNKPHLDVHFYMISSTERVAIPEYADDPQKFDNFPSASYLPANYFVPGGPGVGGAAEPKMGTHWVDANSPELNGGEFTQTFVYGSYDGKVIFYEPMLAYSFLQGTTTFNRDIPQPALVQTSGHYPRKMTVSHSNGEYKVCLEDFYYRKAE